MSVGIGVCNALERPLRDLILSINFYQDHHNGVNNYRLDTRLSTAGANKVMLPIVRINRIYLFIIEILIDKMNVFFYSSKNTDALITSVELYSSPLDNTRWTYNAVAVNRHPGRQPCAPN